MKKVFTLSMMVFALNGALNALQPDEKVFEQTDADAAAALRQLEMGQLDLKSDAAKALVQSGEIKIVDVDAADFDAK